MEPVQLPPLRLNPPAAEMRVSGDATVSMVARLIASGIATSKAELANLTGISRSSITAAVERLRRAGVICTEGTAPRNGRGRPAEALSLSPSAATILVFDAGATSTRLAVADLGQRILAERTVTLNVAIGPEETLRILIEHMRELIDDSGVDTTNCMVVLGLPARLDYQAGVPVRPAIMPGWDGFHVRRPLRQEFNCHVIIESDANLRALGEARALAPDQSPLLAIKVGTGIGAGLITEEGKLHHGSAGAAGEMGHITLRSAPPVMCTCGNTACLEAVASIPAMIRRYREESPDNAPETAPALAALIASTDRVAITLVRETARYLGEAVADMVNVYNPARVVLHGPTTSASDDLLARVRSMVYEHARPLATRNLQVAFSILDERAGIAGAVVLGMEYLLSPEALAHQIQSALRPTAALPR